MKNLKASKAKQGTKNPMFGKKHSEETKQKMRANGKNHFKSGSEHPMWKGGVTPLWKSMRDSYQYKLWKRAVKERDGQKCIWCGATESLHADHIKSFILFPELRFAIDNGRTLCFSCHKTTETYGKQINK